MTGVVEEFLDGLRAGEPKAVEAAERLLGTMAQHREPPALSPRQEQILGLLAQGFSDGEIALRLGISTYTAREHVRRAKYALGARTRAHAVVLWLATQRGSDAARTPHAHRGNGAGEYTASSA